MTIEEGFKFYLKKGYPGDAFQEVGLTQYKEMKRAFFGGYAKCIVDLISLEGTVDEGAEQLEKRRIECTEFFNKEAHASI